MSWWDQKAASLQQGVRHDELRHGHEYGDSEVKRATVHAREDIVLIVSRLSSVNQQLASIRYTLILFVLAVIAIGLKVAHYW